MQSLKLKTYFNWSGKFNLPGYDIIAWYIRNIECCIFFGICIFKCTLSG